MEVKVNVTLDLGTATVALLNGLVKGFSAPVMAASPEAKEAVREVVKEQTKVEEKPAATASPAKPAATAKPAPAPKPAAPAKPAFADMNDDDKLETLKAEVTRHVKNKKGSDIKFMLAQFDAGRASDLSPESYDAFYDAIQRYGKGESLSDIFPADENLA